METIPSLTIRITNLFLFFLGMYIIYEIIVYLLRISSTSSCGCGNKTDAAYALSDLDFGGEDKTILSPKDKACIAVGICPDNEFGYKANDKHKWKSLIIKNADKIFSGQLSENKKGPSKKTPIKGKRK